MNFGITNSTFDDSMKLADITPIFKKDEIIRKENYRPISCLPAGSKIFERILQNQINSYIEIYLSPFLCAQYAVMTLLEKCRISIDKKGYGGAILMDLSKAFDSLNHELLVAKLHAYGFSYSSIKLILSYLSNRWQRTKINNTYSSWVEILLGVPQGSILGPLFFNIYLNDLFFIELKSNLCNFADDNTIYACDTSLDVLVSKLESSAEAVIKWFDYNCMKLNESKCKLLISGNKEEVIMASVRKSQIIESHKVTLLGIHIDRELKFDDHMYEKCNKAGNKLNALIRLCTILPFHKRRLLMMAFINSQFSYSPLVSLFYSRTLNNKINSLHYRALKFVYQDLSSFQELLNKDNSVSIHHRNFQYLAIELYKVQSGNAPFLLREIFQRRSVPENSVVGNLRSQTTFYNYHNPRSVRFGTETLRDLGPKIWNIIPIDIKNSTSFTIFKQRIKNWVPTNCPCRLCRNYVEGIGFL